MNEADRNRAAMLAAQAMARRPRDFTPWEFCEAVVFGVVIGWVSAFLWVHG